MKITILTLFPEMYKGFLDTSIIKRALAKDLVSVELLNIRDYTTDKYGRVDSSPTGGGAGLVMKCQPVVDALASCKTSSSYSILMSPRGKTFTQKIAHSYTSLEHLIIVCGHYEGVDERVNKYVDELVSIGDYILTGGELASMIISDAIIRLLDGTIADASIIEETFENGLLEYPQFTFPYDFNGDRIPDILFSGNHGAIAKWRQKQSLKLTQIYRPDLFAKYNATKTDQKLLKELAEDIDGDWQIQAIEKGKKFIKDND